MLNFNLKSWNSLEVDEDYVLQELGCEEEVALLDEHVDGLDARLRLDDARVTVLGVVHHDLPDDEPDVVKWRKNRTMTWQCQEWIWFLLSV